jgi:hypothetical protein
MDRKGLLLTLKKKGIMQDVQKGAGTQKQSLHLLYTLLVSHPQSPNISLSFIPSVSALHFQLAHFPSNFENKCLHKLST